MSKQKPTKSEIYAIMFLVKRGFLKFELNLNEPVQPTKEIQ